MAQVLRFTTGKFDVSRERPNPINPIAGQSLLLWLRQQAHPRIEVSEPEAEDWGWYSRVDWKGRSCMLGSSASEEAGGAEREWILQIVKYRSFKEKVLGRGKMTRSDECAAWFRSLLEREPAFVDVACDSVTIPPFHHSVKRTTAGRR